MLMVAGMSSAAPADTGCRHVDSSAFNRGICRRGTVASAAAFACAPEMSAYNASKAAVVALTETLVQEVRGTGIRAAVAMPGFFPTNLLESARAPDAALGFARALMAGSRYTAERAAADMLAACARGATTIVLPAPYRMLWRLKRHLPRYFARLLARRRGGRSTVRT
jgi:short-subunit dehydrogenase